MFKQNDEISNTEKLDLIKVKELPSKFLPYPEDLEISYKTYRWGDVKRASQSKFSEKDTVEFVASGIIVESKLEPEFVVKDLTLSDFLYIGLLRKLSSFGAKEFQLTFKCVKCSNIGTEKISWLNLEFDDLEIPKLPIMVKLGQGRILKFNSLTVLGYINLLECEQAEDELRALFEQLANKKVITFKEFCDLSIEDGRVIDRVDNLLYHGLKILKFKCKAEIGEKKKLCNHLNRVSVDGKGVLLRPFRETSDVEDDSIFYGLQTSH